MDRTAVLANAAAILVTIAGLTQPRTRRLVALAGVVISAVALGSLIVSYGHGLFGWQEAGFRTPVALAMITEAGAVILLAIAVTLDPEAVRPATAARSPSSARTTASTQRLDSIDRGPHPSSDARRTGEAHAGAVDGCENCLAAGAGRVRRPDECERKASV